MGLSITINKPRTTKTDASQVQSAFEVIISDTPSTTAFDVIIKEYK